MSLRGPQNADIITEIVVELSFQIAFQTFLLVPDVHHGSCTLQSVDYNIWFLNTFNKRSWFYCIELDENISLVSKSLKLTIRHRRVNGYKRVLIYKL